MHDQENAIGETHVGGSSSGENLMRQVGLVLLRGVVDGLEGLNLVRVFVQPSGHID